MTVASQFACLLRTSRQIAMMTINGLLAVSSVLYIDVVVDDLMRDVGCLDVRKASLSSRILYTRNYYTPPSVLSVVALSEHGRRMLTLGSCLPVRTSRKNDVQLRYHLTLWAESVCRLTFVCIHRRQHRFSYPCFLHFAMRLPQSV